VPGFETSGATEELAFDRIDEQTAVAIANEVFGVSAVGAVRLQTERDDTFRLTAAPADLVLKVAHPADDPADLDFQTRALAWAQQRDETLPLQRVLPALDGSLTPTLAAHGGRIARLFDWLPGELLVDVTLDDQQLSLLGDSVGRLTNAMEGFEHPASSRPFAWDLGQFDRLSAVAERFPEFEIDEVFDRFRQVVVPRLGELPRQVIHNDFNPGNVLVDRTAQGFVTGILDFGDVISTIRIADLAIPLCYLLYPPPRRWAELRPLIDAYELRVPVTGAERDVLKTLVLCRFAQRVLINEWLSQFSNDRGRDEAFRAGVRGALHRLLEED
jgi:Ser/Thr protein kinase RdoA (MazF antagonist)